MIGCNHCFYSKKLVLRVLNTPARGTIFLSHASSLRSRLRWGGLTADGRSSLRTPGVRRCSGDVAFPSRQFASLTAPMGGLTAGGRSSLRTPGFDAALEMWRSHHASSLRSRLRWGGLTAGACPSISSGSNVLSHDALIVGAFRGRSGKTIHRFDLRASQPQRARLPGWGWGVASGLR
jgi:hypothetical protein